MKMIKKLLMYSLFGLACGLLMNASTFAQSRKTVKTSKSGKASREKSERAERAEKERNEKAVKNGYDPVKNKAAQNKKTVNLPMNYYGESDSLTNLSRIRRNRLAVDKDKGKLQESDQEPLLEDNTEPISGDSVPDAPIQNETEKPQAATQGTSFDGVGKGLAGSTVNSAPPDTTMAVGPKHIVSWVNSQYAVFDKSGKKLLGPVNGNTLFTGLGNVCETTNRGDPILQYDRLADRWVLSQFAFNSSTAPPLLQCIAVSTTGDPTGTYYRYTINFDATGFNDYGKLGVWNDAYYTAYNIFNSAGSNTGSAMCASDRTKMLAGDATATTLCAPTAIYGGGAAFLPADLDGTDLPTDTTRGGVFMRYSTSLNLRMLRLKPNFTAGTATLTDGYGGASGSFVQFPVGATTLPCNGANGTCVAQPGTTNKLDTLGGRLMYRLAYRNRGGVDSLVVILSVDPDAAGTQSSAVRWFEIRNPLNDPADAVSGRRPFLYQNSTYNPGATGDRWMGSTAVNRYGDQMVGYSVVNTTAAVKPSIGVAGRLQGDALNTLQAEQIAQVGGGVQTGTLTRWGDYSTMQVDPVDETTFWYTTEYLAVDGSFNWSTRIVSFTFPTTTAVADGDFGVAANWNNGVPNAALTGIVPAGRTLTVNTPATIGNLDVRSGGNLVMNANLDIAGSLTLGTKINTGSNTLGLGCNGTVSGASANNYVIGNLRKDYCQAQAFTYPTGTANGYSPVNANVTALPTNPSSLAINAMQGNFPGMAAAQSAQRFWRLTKTGSLTTDLVFNYLDADVVGTEANYKLYRFDGSSPTAVTPFTLDTTANTISANGLSNFSDWTIGNLGPTAAGSEVSGKILDPSRRPVASAIVKITDTQGNSRTVRSSAFGFFQFGQVASGSNYVVSVSAKGLQFSPQVINVQDDITNLEIIGNR